jgi:Mg2+ and Co2+ transporter CorA
MTILQLPLSFFTSYFGMNVIEQTGQTGDQQLSHVWIVMGMHSIP